MILHKISCLIMGPVMDNSTCTEQFLHHWCTINKLWCKTPLFLPLNWFSYWLGINVLIVSCINAGNYWYINVTKQHFLYKICLYHRYKLCKALFPHLTLPISMATSNLKQYQLDISINITLRCFTSYLHHCGHTLSYCQYLEPQVTSAVVQGTITY